MEHKFTVINDLTEESQGFKVIRINQKSYLYGVMPNQIKSRLAEKNVIYKEGGGFDQSIAVVNAWHQRLATAVSSRCSLIRLRAASSCTGRGPKWWRGARLRRSQSSF